MDSLLSIVQMPAGVPVATFAIGEAGAKNAALFAVGILSLQDEEIRQRLLAWRQVQTDAVADRPKSDLKNENKNHRYFRLWPAWPDDRYRRRRDGGARPYFRSRCTR